MKTFAEELKTLADAAQILGSETSSVEGHTYSLLQVSSFAATFDLNGFEVVTMVRHLEEHSAALSQLASRTSACHDVRLLVRIRLP